MNPAAQRAMTSTLPWTGAPALGWPDLRQAMRRLPPAVLHGLVAAAALCALCALGMPAAVALLAPSAPDLVPVTAVDARSAGQHQRARCDGCGVVEAIRTIDGIGDQPPSYEFTVRLKDQSIRTSVTATADRWRVGDRIILLGGAGNP